MEGMQTAHGCLAVDDCQSPAGTGQAVIQGPDSSCSAGQLDRIDGPAEGPDRVVTDSQSMMGQWHWYTVPRNLVLQLWSSSSAGQSCSAGLAGSQLEGMQDTVVDSWGSDTGLAEVGWPRMLVRSDQRC